MAEAGAGHGIDMTQGSPFKILFQFSMPLFLGNLLQQVYNIVDSSVAGNFIGMNALSAVSNGYSIVMMITTMFSGISVGGTVIIAQQIGRKDYDGVRRTVNAIYFGVAVIFIPLMIIGYFSAAPLLSLFNVPDEIMPDAVTYIRVIFIGVLGGMGYNVNAGILNGLGDSKTSLKFLAIACVGNIILDVWFVAGIGMGVFGTALATIIAQAFSWILSVYHINRHYEYIHIGLPRKGIDFFLMRQCLRVGIPSCIANLQYSIGMMMIQALINGFGTDFIAGYSAASKIDAFVFMPILSVSSACSTYAGQNMGAGKIDRIRKGTWSAILLITAVCVGFALIFVPFGRPILKVLFNLTPEAMDVGMRYLYWVMVPSSILGVSYVLNGMLRGVGAVMVSTVSGIIALWVVRIPLAYLFADLFGRENLFASFIVGWISGIIISGIYYWSGRWEKKKVLGNSADENDIRNE